jgi:hypothetical protein
MNRRAADAVRERDVARQGRDDARRATERMREENEKLIELCGLQRERLDRVTE